MAVFEYEGLDAKGRRAKGIIDADGLRAARAKLKQQGIFATGLSEAKRSGSSESKAGEGFFPRKIAVKELALLTRQLATLLSAGLPLVSALGALLEQSDSEKTTRIMSQLREKVNEGKSFHEALEDHAKSFPDIYRNMIRSGEASGTLPLVMGRLADFMESSAAFRNKLMTALAYPVLMGFLGMGILWFLLSYVVPKVTGIFDSLKMTLPLATRMLLALSGAFRQYWWVGLASAAATVFGFFKYYKTPDGRMTVHGILLKTPAVGKFIRVVAVSRFSKTLGTLLSSGVPLLTALGISRSVLGNAVLEKAVEEAATEVREGKSLAAALRARNCFPSAVCQMVGVGEESGAMDELLLKVSEAYESQVEAAMATLTSLLEPLMILGMAVVVGFVVIAILLPMMEMTQGIK